MSLLATVTTFFTKFPLIGSAIDGIKAAMGNKYVWIGVGVVILLWFYDSLVEAKYKYERSEQEVELLLETVQQYEKSIKELATHTEEVYKERYQLEQQLLLLTPVDFEDWEEEWVGVGVDDVKKEPEEVKETQRLINRFTLDIFKSIEGSLNGGVNGR
ncbi:MAG: hypothetical protein LPH21_19030 [Shewanella sp.]|nr:hypothetical protein [Shewanella sp.]